MTLAAAAWKLLSAHAAQATPGPAASCSAQHTQVLTSSRTLPICAVLAGHAWHIEALVAARSAENVLLAHSVYTMLPLAGLKRPVAHSTHPPDAMPPTLGV